MAGVANNIGSAKINLLCTPVIGCLPSGFTHKTRSLLIPGGNSVARKCYRGKPPWASGAERSGEDCGRRWWASLASHLRCPHCRSASSITSGYERGRVVLEISQNRRFFYVGQKTPA